MKQHRSIDMSKADKELAKKIVDKLAEITKLGELQYKGTLGGKLPYLDFYGDSKKTVTKQMIGHIASDLESGSLTLSDAWVEDNIGV